MSAAQVTRIGLAVVAGDGALLLAYALSVFGTVSSSTWGQLFDLNGEATIPAWYSSAQLLLTGALLLWSATIPVPARTDGWTPSDRRGHPPVSPRFLAALGSAFCFLSLDEVAGIHETLSFVLRRVEALPRFSGDHGIWIPIYLAIGAAFVLGTARQWRALWRADRRGLGWLLAGALLFLVGGVGVEVMSYGALRRAPGVGLYHLQVSVEEGLELFGATGMLLGAAHVANRRALPNP